MNRKTIVLLLCIAAAAAPLISASEAGDPVVIASSHTIASEILQEDRRINVYLPPGRESTDERYPVLYLLDGGVKEDFIHIVGIASLAADFRKIRPFVVVGIEGIDRYHDLSHPTSVEREQERVPNHGGSSDFRRFIADELVPFVQSRFPVTDERVLIGESMAGLFVTETFLRQPSLFGAYIAVSPSLWWDGASLSREAATALQASPFPPGRRLYLTVADEGGAMREAIDSLAASLEAHAPAGLDWIYEPMPSESHGTVFHPAALAAVRRLFATAAKPDGKGPGS